MTLRLFFFSICKYKNAVWDKFANNLLAKFDPVFDEY